MAPGTGAGGATGRDGLRAVVVLLLAVLQVASGPLTFALLGADSSTGAVSDSLSTVITPAGYAFAIWGLVYAASLAYAVRQALPSQRARAVHRRTGWWLATAFAASTAWVPVFGLRWVPVSLLVIGVLVAALAVALARLEPLDGGAADRWLIAVPVALYLGWASLASVANAATTGVALGAPTTGPVASTAAVVALVVATGVVTWVAATTPGVAAFVAAASWALVAVGVGSASGVVSRTAYACAAVAVAALVVRLVRSSRPARVARG